jgi:hypothetical protein
MSKAPQTDLVCPYCSTLVLRLPMPMSGVRLKLRCPNVSCRHRLTIVNVQDRVDESWKLKCFASLDDRKRDGEELSADLTELDLLPLPKVLTMLNERNDALDAFVRSHEEEIDRLQRYYNRRRKSEIDFADTQRALSAAKTKALKHQTKKVNEAAEVRDKNGQLSPEAETFRGQCLFFLERLLNKGKIDPARAAELTRKSHVPSGLNELARAVGVDTLFD